MDAITISLHFDTLVSGEDEAWSCVEGFWARAQAQGFLRDECTWNLTLSKSYQGHDAIRVVLAVSQREGA